MINFSYRSNKSNSIEKTITPQKDSWIFAYDINQEEMDSLINLGFDKDLLEDATDYFEVPRFEYEDSVNYLFTRYVVNTKDGELSTAPLMIAISETMVLTVSPRKPEFLDDFAHGRKKITITQKNKMALHFLESIMYEYHKSIMNIRRQMLRYFSNVGNISESDMKKFVGLESTLADYMGALSPTDMALTMMLTRHKSLTLHEEDVDMLEDIKQDIKQLIESSRTISKTIQNIRSAHSSILAHKLNNTMKTLTIVTIVLTIPTIITSLFGMNVWLPVQNGPLSFIIIIIIMILISLLVLRYLTKNTWM